MFYSLNFDLGAKLKFVLFLKFDMYWSSNIKNNKYSYFNQTVLNIVSCFLNNVPYQHLSLNVLKGVNNSNTNLKSFDISKCFNSIGFERLYIFIF